MLQHKKITQALSLALVLQGAAHAAPSCTPCLKPVAISCPTASCNVNVTLISQADVDSTGYVITTSGRYCLIEDITFTPLTSVTLSATRVSSPATAITILASNVELDLNGYVLSTASTSSTVGIKIASSSTTLENVIIEGSRGSVQGFSVGIFADPVQGLLIENLSALNNGANGSVTTSNSTVLVGGLVIAGNSTVPSTNVILKNVAANYNGGSSGINTFGAEFENVVNAIVEQCQFNNNVSNAITYGLDIASLPAPPASTNSSILVNDSTANENSGSNAVKGFAFFGYDTQFAFNRCTSSHNLLAGTATSAGPNFAVGFETSNGNQFTLNDCISIGHATAAGYVSGVNGTSAAGFNLQPRSNNASGNFRLNRCIAGDIGTNGFTAVVTQATGFTLSNALDGQLINCVSDSPEGTNLSVGYFLSGTKNIALIDCVANGAGVTNANGVRIINGNANVVEGCLIQDNNPDGILLAESSPCLTQENVIKHNQIKLSPSMTGVWAIEDVSGNPIPNNAYYDNYAFNYPGNDGSDYTNYSTGVRLAGGSPDGTENQYIAPWNIAGLPPSYTGLTKLTNLDITYDPCGN